MFRGLVVPLMLTVILGGGLGCQSSSDSEAPSTSGALSGPPATPSISQTEAIKQATQTTDPWLKLIDEGKYGDAWDQTGKTFKGTSIKDSWSKQTAAIRTAMGPVASRTMKQGEYKNKIAEGPAGDYVTLHYDTAFKATSLGTEEVTLARNKDGTWTPLGYYVSVKPAPAGKSTP